MRHHLASASASASILLVALSATLLGCAKAPPTVAGIPYAGAVGSGKDWNASVDHVDLTIDATRVGRPISPLIYGYNAIRDPGARGVTLLRAGGNRYTAYNWENNASNAGADFKFQNDGFLVTGATNPDAPGEALRPMLQTAAQIGATAIVTLPIVDHVAKDKLGDGDVTSSGADYLNTRFVKNLPTRGAPPVADTLAGFSPDPSDDTVYQDEFVAWLGQNFPTVPLMFSLDNEPDLWSQTHKEVHPQPVSYDELVKRDTDTARAVKAVKADAAVLGFVSYGWQGYVSLQNAPDSGKGNFIDYYLEHLKAAELAEGKRLVDYLDLHWYPEATGIGASGAAVRVVFGANDTSPGVIEARVQAPRSLWDPGYHEKSWIAGAAGGGSISLIPRIEDQIARNYPGTKLSFTEWNYGGGGHISGAVATADVLGIFGREGVGLATVWPNGNEPFTEAGLAIFRSYDGAGARFGDTSIAAETSSIYSSTVYASVDAADPARMVIVAINKRAETTSATVTVKTSPDGSAGPTAAMVWVLAGTSATIQAGPPLMASSAGTFEYDMPALSVSVLVPGN